MSALAALILGFLINLNVFLLILITGAVGLLYSVKVVPARLRGKTRFSKLKDIPASKTFVVSGGWALSLSLMPVLAAGRTVGLATGLVALVIFLLVFIRSALGGIFDIQGDRIVGYETIPILIGEERTLKLLYLAGSPGSPGISRRVATRPAAVFGPVSSGASGLYPVLYPALPEKAVYRRHFFRSPVRRRFSAGRPDIVVLVVGDPWPAGRLISQPD